jgi:CheY-like chemotaxis protein/HPt (histidine-containing phosphotransfer) domain-containing protein
MLATWGIEAEFLAELGEVHWSAKSARLRNPAAAPFAVLAANPGDAVQSDAVVRVLAQAAAIGAPLFVSVPFIAQSQGLAYLQAGAAGLLTKPFRASQLREALGGALPGLFREADAGISGDDISAMPRLDWKRPPRVLVVDDHPVNLEVAASLLTRLGCVPDAVEDGPQSLILLRWKTYDLVLMDCEMPGMDGFETTRLIREGEKGKAHTPIVALTAHAVAGARERCLAAGMDDYLAKPFSAQQIAHILQQWIPLAGREEAGSARPVLPAREAAPRQESDRTREDGSGPVDWTRLAALGDGLADQERIRHLVSLFLRTTRSSLESLGSLRTEADLPQARKTLHRLKGSCATLGARRMAGLIQDMEKAAEAGESARLAPMLDVLEEAFRETAQLLEERAG